MLSYIYSIVGDFERRHGHIPNLLYISPEHLQRLRRSFAGHEDMEDLVRLLGMHIVITRDVTHPRVAWSENSWVQRSAV